MSFAPARKTEELSKASDPKKAIIEAAGDLSGISLYSNHILVGTYIRPEKTGGGIIRPQSNVGEDQFQGKVGLVLKKGPLAFMDDEAGQNIEIGDWSVYRVNDGWAVTINGTPCRVIQDIHIRMKLASPELVF